MRTLKIKAQIFVTVNEMFGESSPTKLPQIPTTTSYCFGVWTGLNDFITARGGSRRIKLATEHLIDGSEKTHFVY